MIVLDTSALIAIINSEPEAADLVDAIGRADTALLSSASYVEAAMVASRWAGGRDALDRWLAATGVVITPVDEAQARLAADAFIKFGKGRHPAGLNFGDTFAYALAKSRDCLLLFKGDDFERTDVRVA